MLDKMPEIKVPEVLATYLKFKAFDKSKYEFPEDISNLRYKGPMEFEDESVYYG